MIEVKEVIKNRESVLEITMTEDVDVNELVLFANLTFEAIRDKYKLPEEFLDILKKVFLNEDDLMAQSYIEGLKALSDIKVIEKSEQEEIEDDLF